MKMLMMAVSAVLFGASFASAADYHVIASKTDLSLATSYQENALPGDGDSLYLNGETYAVNSASMGVLQDVACIYLPDGGDIRVADASASDFSRLTPKIVVSGSATVEATDKLFVRRGATSESAATLKLKDASSGAGYVRAAGLDGAIGVETDGAATLAGNLPFSGPLTVNSGTLRLNTTSTTAPQPFKYYRFTVCQIGKDDLSRNYDSGDKLILAELCLYAADGTRQNAGLTMPRVMPGTTTPLHEHDGEYYVTANGDGEGTHANDRIQNIPAASLNPGEVYFDTSMEGWTARQNISLDGLFDAKGITSVELVFRGSKTANWVVRSPSLTGGSWQSYVMCLPEDAKPITHFDFLLGANSSDYTKAAPYYIMLEGSPNGTNWQTIYSNAESGSLGPRWASVWGTVSGSYNQFWLSDLKWDLSARPTKAYAKDYAYNTTALCYRWRDEALTPFTYFRFSVAKLGADDVESTTWNARCFGLYAADGTRQNLNLTVLNEAVANVPDGEYTPTSTSGYKLIADWDDKDLVPGTAAWDHSMVGWKSYIGQQTNPPYLARSFDDKASMSVYQFSNDHGYVSPTPANTGRNGWISFVMHLPANAKPVTHFDFNAGWTETSKQVPTRFQLEGSIDGKEWTTVWSNVKGEAKSDWNFGTGGSVYQWASGATAWGEHKDSFAYASDYAYNTSTTGFDELTYSSSYTYFRYRIAQLGPGGKNVATFRQFCLYAKDGTRQNIGLTALNDTIYDGAGHPIPKASSMTPGSVKWDDSMVGWYAGNTGLLTSLFGGDFNKMANFQFSNAKGNVCPDPADESTWLSFVMRLKNGAKPITHFDFQLGWDTTGASAPTRFQFEGSMDGQNWNVLWSNVDGDAITWTGCNDSSAYAWLSTQKSTQHDAKQTKKAYNAEDPYRMSATYGAARQLENIKYLCVKPGATFQGDEGVTISRLGLDFSQFTSTETPGFGTLAFTELAPSGTILLENIPDTDVAIALPTLTNCSGDLTGWTIANLPEKYEASVSGGVLSLKNLTGLSPELPFTSIDQYNAAMNDDARFLANYSGVDVWLNVENFTFEASTDPDHFHEKYSLAKQFGFTNTAPTTPQPKLHLTMRNCVFPGGTLGLMGDSNTNDKEISLNSIKEFLLDGCTFKAFSGDSYVVDLNVANWFECDDCGYTITNCTFEVGAGSRTPISVKNKKANPPAFVNIVGNTFKGTGGIANVICFGDQSTSTTTAGGADFPITIRDNTFVTGTDSEAVSTYKVMTGAYQASGKDTQYVPIAKSFTHTYDTTLAAWVDVPKFSSGAIGVVEVGGLTAAVKNGDCSITGTGALTDASEILALGVTNLTIGAGVTGVGEGAFKDSRSLRTVTLGADCTAISAQAFKGCPNLNAVTIAANATIGEYAFYRCNSLETITFAGKPSSLPANAFNLQTAIYMKNGLPQLYTIPTITIAGYTQKLMGTNDLTGEWTEVTTEQQKADYHFFKMALVEDEPK